VIDEVLDHSLGEQAHCSVGVTTNVDEEVRH
jgi:hypothetical protein